MKNLIAKKRIGRTAPGGKLRVRAHEARTLIALGMAENAPTPKMKTDVAAKGRYARRDMAASEAPISWPDSPVMVTKGDDVQA